MTMNVDVIKIIIIIDIKISFIKYNDKDNKDASNNYAIYIIFCNIR